MDWFSPLLRILFLELEKNSSVVCYTFYRRVIISAPQSHISTPVSNFTTGFWFFPCLPIFWSFKLIEYTGEKLTRVRVVIYSHGLHGIAGQHTHQTSNPGLFSTHSWTQISLTTKSLCLNVFLLEKKRDTLSIVSFLNDSKELPKHTPSILNMKTRKGAKTPESSCQWNKTLVRNNGSKVYCIQSYTPFSRFLNYVHFTNNYFIDIIAFKKWREITSLFINWGTYWYYLLE